MAAKLFTMFLILIVIQASLLIYQAGSAEPTDIWKFVWDFNNWSSLAFILSLVGIAAGIGIIGVSAGSSFKFVTDFIVMGPAIAGLLSIGVVFTNLGKAMYNELVNRIFTECLLTTSCTPATFIIAITLGPLALYYVWTVVEWWRGKDY